MGEPGGGSRIGRLRQLLDNVRNGGWTLVNADPPSVEACVREVVRLLEGLEKAFPGHADGEEGGVTTSVVVVLVVLALVGLAAALLVVGLAWSIWSDYWPDSRPFCPCCRRRRSGVRVERVAVGRRECYGLVTRDADFSRGGYVSARRERVPVVRTKYEVTYLCPSCGGEWSEEEVVEREDFNRP